MRRGRKAKPYPGTFDDLLKVLSYNPETGDMSSIGPYSARPTPNTHGLYMLRLPVPGALTMRGNRQTEYYRADHLAWMYMTGFWPTGWIEYVDGFPYNLKSENIVHVDDDGVRWWYGAQQGREEMVLVRVDGNTSDTGPVIEGYMSDDGEVKIVPRVSEGWVNRVSDPPVEEQLEEDTGLAKGEFGKDWMP